jgi:hypothetical protein
MLKDKIRKSIWRKDPKQKKKKNKDLILHKNKMMGMKLRNEFN